ncbi:DNA repair exonuclease [Paraliobacillus quinghaiensis]|uniref:DNA repair exonuclease n=1 Tax=Paraliobacillus quinghaiensis TaxID=470815 RepID=A0A917TJK1_9BACI|nr:DNA repair exonuclease [Paraliobacillus quinghaiensis]GGM25567.1 DNA repair exonuclease [Paraliobacillus quinghaiensis]
MQEKLSFIHCADLHLDSPFTGLNHLPDRIFQEIKKSTFKALDNLIDVAIKKKVDFILMVGDVFDQTNQSVYAQMQFLKACETLHHAGIAVYLSFGNHDYLQRSLLQFKFPENVHIFTDDTVGSFIFEKNQKQLATIYGFSYLERAVHKNKTEEYQKVSNTPYHIGMLHGSVKQQTDHDVYAPFQVSELDNKGFDYWALGHIHKRQQLKQAPPIVYSGNIQGRSKKETGEKGCYYVEMDGNSVDLTFCPLQTIRFETITLDVNQCTTIQQLEKALDEKIEQIHNTYGKTILRIQLTNFQEVVETWFYEEMIADVIAFLNEKMTIKHDWIWIQAIELSEQKYIDKEALRQGDHFLGEMLRSFENTELKEELEPLWKHRQARKHLTKLTKEDETEIIDQAENLLIYQLLRKEER